MVVDDTQHSGLFKTIERISDPRYLIQYSQPFGASLTRFYRVGVALGRILEMWTAPEVVDAWDSTPYVFVPRHVRYLIYHGES